MIPVALGPPPGEQRSCGAYFGVVAEPLLGCGLGLALEAYGDEARRLSGMHGAALVGQDIAPIAVRTSGARLGDLMWPATAEARVLVPGWPEIWDTGGGPSAALLRPWRALFPARAELAAPSSVD
ncbi:hypothetical protein NDU88_000638 [Pleurodeles waltl]|uniref:Uncharacterized protein n=1 Tax=Pleurodeles waltl TaxID=8319 RepID=A0AAV7SWZ2_PLEWA|nr:hypothetical protein NDU88_000638 [Pleurodeles waltl]